jgi:hypothetical protein
VESIDHAREPDSRQSGKLIFADNSPGVALVLLLSTFLITADDAQVHALRHAADRGTRPAHFCNAGGKDVQAGALSYKTRALRAAI